MIYSRYLLLAIPFLLVLLTGLTHGFLPPDNINYLTMADTQFGQICHVGGQPFGLFPCAYPLAINAVHWLTGLDLFYASKILNLALLVATFYCFHQVVRSVNLALVLAFNPFTIQSAIESGAEIGFLFAFALYCLMVHLIKEKDEVKVQYFLGVLIAIVIGCFSRYMFAPFSVLLFLCSFLLLKQKNWKLLPAFVLAAALFVLYRYYLRDFDMERIPAPESQLLIFFQFIKSSIKAVAFMLPPVLIGLWCWKKSGYKLDYQQRWSWFFGAVGLAYLVMILTLRSMFQFDFFGIRFVGLGYGLILAAVLLMLQKEVNKVRLPLVIVGIVLMYLAVTEASVFRHPMVTAEVKQALNNTIRLKKQDNKPKDYALVVTDRQWIHPEVAVKGVFDTWRDGHVVFLPDLPYQRRYEMDVVQQRLSDKPCKIYFDLQQDINTYINQKYRTGLSEYQLQFSATARDYLVRKYTDNDNNCF
ncbi:hypothetical protein [Planctobacterium marinum]|uniref:hypothetical protein n=1 Tax=Planctobacterium marinum TaxID=1631968 RepID=UPI001E53C82E|nr:hypothetical protein [Planctobacterium marinum]MCC2606095.1 hypothetical protein [Planctobacterium marinum]